MDRTLYLTRVLDDYRRLPGTLHRVLQEDRRRASALYDDGVGLQTVKDAFVLVIARRSFRADTAPLEPIRSLTYLLPLIQELRRSPPPPNYLRHLRRKLAREGLWWDELSPTLRPRRAPATQTPQSGISAPQPRELP